MNHHTQNIRKKAIHIRILDSGMSISCLFVFKPVSNANRNSLNGSINIFSYWDNEFNFKKNALNQHQTIGMN